jgi:hypothetical protein
MFRLNETKWFENLALGLLMLFFFPGLLVFLVPKHVLGFKCWKSQFWIKIWCFCWLSLGLQLLRWNLINDYDALMFLLFLFIKLCLVLVMWFVRPRRPFIGFDIARYISAFFWVLSRVLHILGKNIALVLWFGQVLVYFFALDSSLDFVNY